MGRIAIFWFRRDLRFVDNHALFACLSENKAVMPIFIFDTDILKQFTDPDDRRISLIYQRIESLNEELRSSGRKITVYTGKPVEIFKTLFTEKSISAVYSNADYEPYARKRDLAVQVLCENHGAGFVQKKDHLIFEKSEVLKKDETPYLVFTPYAKAWRRKFAEIGLDQFDSENYLQNIIPADDFEYLTIESLGYRRNSVGCVVQLDTDKLENYSINRDFPALDGSLRISVALRFGFVSIREIFAKSHGFDIFQNELVWREFYAMVLWHFPDCVDKAIKPKYDSIEYISDEEKFEFWCQGKTGYPLVDAGMRQLNETGFMHNRVRMVVSSFLTKHLLTDWRWGELYFRQKLLDFDLASNVGGWQWASGSGCDAAPYFRIFNPQRQQEKFDSNFMYIKQWVPEFGTADYCSPIVEHTMARERALSAYKKALNSN